MWGKMEMEGVNGRHKEDGRESKLRIFCKYCENLMHYKLHKCTYIYESDLNEILNNQGDGTPTDTLLLTNEAFNTGIVTHIIELLDLRHSMRSP